VCGRFIDSNGYSLRVGDADLSPAHRLRVQQRGSELQLLASAPAGGGEVLVGRGSLPRRDRDLFVALQLEPGWELRRRMFGERSLNHVYFANSQTLPDLLVASRGRPPVVDTPRPMELPVIPPPLAPGRSPVDRAERPLRSPRMLQANRRGPATPADQPAASSSGELGMGEGAGSGVVALQVIPYEDRLGGDNRSESASESRSASQGL
jgi:hypothetical protein